MQEGKVYYDFSDDVRASILREQQEKLLGLPPGTLKDEDFKIPPEPEPEPGLDNLRFYDPTKFDLEKVCPPVGTRLTPADLIPKPNEAEEAERLIRERERQLKEQKKKEQWESLTDKILYPFSIVVVILTILLIIILNLT